MKVYELQAILDCHDPTADVVIATTNYGKAAVLIKTRSSLNSL
jgi:hypothetical protein